MFIDEIEIWVKAGNGGNGCLSFHREKFIAKGGPDGGDGGRGGHVIFEVDPQLSTLVDLRYKKQYKAKNGTNGQGSDKHGRNAKDLIVRIPPGTLVKHHDSDEVLADLSTPHEQFIAAKGGDGGRGNARFKSSTNQAPRRFEEGWPGEERFLQLELKLLADVGIIGLPNAGKSTLISRISAARPKIANYPFTTLVPNLGVVRIGDYRSFVVVDIPGLIEGASHGTGLGFQFLRHIERTRMFVHMVDLSSETDRDPVDDFITINTELEQYDPTLCQRPQIVAANKIDVLDDDARLQKLQNFCKGRDMACYPISAVSGEGVSAVIQHITQLLYPTE
jgi:GTP-binding protein